MANTNVAFGLKPVRYRGGAPYNGATTKVSIPASDSNAMAIGDPVVLAGSADANGVPTVALATASGGANSVSGVIVGFEPSDSINDNGYRLASTAAYALIADDPSLIFEVQEDSDGGALAATDVGLNVDLEAGSVNTTTKRSGWELDSSTANTTATLQCRIEGFVQREDNEIGANAKILVSINTHTANGDTAGK